MNFDDQDWESAQPSSQEAQGNSTPWKVAAGVVVGIALGGTLVYALDRLLPQLALSETAKAMGQAMRDSSQTREREPVPEVRQTTVQDAFPASRDEPLRQVQAEPQPAASSAVASALPEGVARVERKAEPRQQAAQKDLERKERVWAEFYKKPRDCIDRPSADTLVECANHYIRARREFEQTYAEGSR